MAKKSPQKSASTRRKTTATRTPRKAVTKPAARPAGQKPAARTKPSGPAKRPPTQALVEGTTAPQFTLPQDDGSTVSLKDFRGRKLVIYFYPRADTPGCTREAIDFTRLRDEFAKANTAVIGISADPPKAQTAFRKKHELAIPLLSDEARTTIAAYGAWGEKSMYGRVFEGILRTTVLIGADGKIGRLWRHVKVDGHADAVLEAARAL